MYYPQRHYNHTGHDTTVGVALTHHLTRSKFIHSPHPRKYAQITSRRRYQSRATNSVSEGAITPRLARTVCARTMRSHAWKDTPKNYPPRNLHRLLYTVCRTRSDGTQGRAWQALNPFAEYHKIFQRSNGDVVVLSCTIIMTRSYLKPKDEKDWTS